VNLFEFFLILCEIKMEIEFVKQYLLELYTTGKSNDKRYRFQPNIITKYIQTIDRLRALNRLEELYLIKSLNFKSLKGDKIGFLSVRVNTQYRIEFSVMKRKNADSLITVLSIIELSNHYS
jgi:proteic killer suppression protein